MRCAPQLFDGFAQASIILLKTSEAVLKTSIEIDQELEHRIQRLAEVCDRSAEHLIRDAIDCYAGQIEARKSFVQEADASWDAYRKDGLHLTGEEVRAWLKTVGTDAERPPPECHE